ncbi:surface protein [Bifidobacterium commune]|nr:surface protein [Bifidobacterium commune]
MGEPANDSTVNRVPGRDPSPIQWELGSDCTLTIHHGTSPNKVGVWPWQQNAVIGNNYVAKVRIDGNVTLYSDGDGYSPFRLRTLREVRVDGTLHLAGNMAESLFVFDSSLSDFTGAGLSGFETSQAKNMSYMFFACKELTSLDVTKFNTANVTNMSHMFEDCAKLTSLDVTKFNTTNVTDMNSMFKGCNSLTSLDVTKFNTTNVTNMSHMFEDCAKLTPLDVTKFNTANVTNMSGMFQGCNSLTPLDVTKFDTTNVTNMNNMFRGCNSLTSLDVTKFNTANVTNMSGMFAACRKLTSLDVTRFDTANVTDMSHMFDLCVKLTPLDVTKFNTANVTDMSSMFQDCHSLTFLDVTKFNTANVRYMSHMFQDCHSLTSLDVTKFNTANVRYMDWMFNRCAGLTSLDVTKFNTANVTNMAWMFKGCKKLTSLDLSSFDTRLSLTYDLDTVMGYGVQGMLADNPSLRELWLGPHTHLAKNDNDSRVFWDSTAGDPATNLPYDTWVEVPATGRGIPVPDMRSRTSVSSGRNPQGHYVMPVLALTIDYNNGLADHVDTISINTARAGSKQIPWSRQGAPVPAPDGKLFDGWDLATNHPDHLTVSGNTVSWTAANYLDADAKVTAKWRTLGQPAISLNVHADARTNPWGSTDPWVEVTTTLPSGRRAGDAISLQSANGTGYNGTCTPTADTCTFNLTVGQVRDPADFEAAYRLTAAVSATDIRTDPAGTATGPTTEQQGILPYTSINYHPGVGTGTPPATDKALTDTNSRRAWLTVAGPSPITRPAHSLFDTWRSSHGTVEPGVTPVPVSMGDTDTKGRTVLELTALWTLLAAPGLSAARANNGTISVTGTSKPRRGTDTVHVCHPAANGTPRCLDITPDASGPGGNTLPYDGATEHPWTITLPVDTPTDEGTIDATLNTIDTAYPAPGQPVQSPTTSTPVPPLSLQSLPLTGGRATPTLLALAATLTTAMILVAAATRLSAHRRKARHRNTTGQPNAQ